MGTTSRACYIDWHLYVLLTFYKSIQTAVLGWSLFFAAALWSHHLTKMPNEFLTTIDYFLIIVFLFFGLIPINMWLYYQRLKREKRHENTVLNEGRTM
jgi:hypothetical protein